MNSLIYRPNLVCDGMSELPAKVWKCGHLRLTLNPVQHVWGTTGSSVAV